MQIVSATQDLINKLKGNLRKADQKEVMAVSGQTADEGMQMGFEQSVYCWVGIFEGKPFCAFGVVPYNHGMIGSVWLLATDDIRKIKVGVLKQSKKYINKMLTPFLMLENRVDVRNILSINWLKWCGFIIEDPKPYGIEGRMFHYFHLVNEVKRV